MFKKIKKVQGGGHHGGAWKVAYADFVTAMMAFFLLLWLLNATTKEQKQGIANYFAPTTISESNSGAGGVLDGIAVSEINSSEQVAIPTPATQTTVKSETDAEAMANAAFQAKQEKILKDTISAIQQEIQKTPELKELAENIILEITKDGLLIQLVDTQKRPMFESGTAKALPHTIIILKRLRPILDRLPNPVQITGHTDNSASTNPDYGNWELSADRANTSRRILQHYGLKKERLDKVIGKADTELLTPTKPDAPINRRISILLSFMEPPKMDKRSKPVTPIKRGVF